MEVELLIHGVPDGHDYYGIKVEQSNMSLFYDNSTEPVKFVVETKKNGNNVYAYYSYLRYKNIIGSGGRPGSYFGITIRIDKYYQDAIHIYSMLEMLFKRYIVGTILVASGDGYKYLVPNFASKSTEIDKTQQFFLQLFQTTCVSSKFLDIDASFIHPIAKAPACNLIEINEGTILASMKKYSKIILSPNYELSIEQEYKKKIQEAEGKFGNVVGQKDKTIAEKDADIKKLNDSVSNLKKRIASLEQEVERKDSDIQNGKRLGNLVQEVARIKEPISAIAEFFRNQDSQKNPLHTQFGKKTYRLELLSCVLLTVVLILSVIGLFRIPSGAPKNDNKLKELTAQVEQLKSENQDLKTKIASLTDAAPQNGVMPSETTGSSPTVTLRIDVAQYSKGKLKVGNQYIVSVKNGTTKYVGGGKWTLKNANIVVGNVSDSEITITPTGGKVELSYKPNDANCSCPARSFDTEIVASSPTIVIEPNVNEVELDKEYTFSIKGYTGSGTWGVDGFSSPGDKTAKKITVKAIDTGSGATTATISFTPDDGSKKTRTFNFKKNS